MQSANAIQEQYKYYCYLSFCILWNHLPPHTLPHHLGIADSQGVASDIHGPTLWATTATRPFHSSRVPVQTQLCCQQK
jgi:hypothetical protein